MSTDITITGNITREPELRFTPTNGTPVANLDVAVNSRKRDASGEWVDGEPTFYPVTVWGAQAEQVATSVATGTRVVVTGRIGARSWENGEGEKRTRLEVVADEVAVSLRWAEAVVTKKARTRDVPPAAGDEEPPF